MLELLNPDLQREILNHLDSLFAIRNTCKSLKFLLDNYGYLRKINYNIHTDFMEFIGIYDKFSNSIRTLHIDSVIEPIMIVPEWPQVVNFNNCVMGKEYIDPHTTSTEILSIVDHTRNSLLHINWKKFPKLRAMYIRVWDISKWVLDSSTQLDRIYRHYLILIILMFQSVILLMIFFVLFT